MKFLIKRNDAPDMQEPTVVAELVLGRDFQDRATLKERTCIKDEELLIVMNGTIVMSVKPDGRLYRWINSGKVPGLTVNRDGQIDTK